MAPRPGRPAGSKTYRPAAPPPPPRAVRTIKLPVGLDARLRLMAAAEGRDVNAQIVHLLRPLVEGWTGRGAWTPPWGEP